MWRRPCLLSTRGTRSTTVDASRPSLRERAPKYQNAPGIWIFGAGEGNRTLVVSLEGFCSTIELHPPGRGAAMPFEPEPRQPDTASLDGVQALGLAIASMRHLNAIAVTPTAPTWWCAQSFAARWRD
jgi:hypothetical protein